MEAGGKATEESPLLEIPAAAAAAADTSGPGARGLDLAAVESPEVPASTAGCGSGSVFSDTESSCTSGGSGACLHDKHEEEVQKGQQSSGVAMAVSGDEALRSCHQAECASPRSPTVGPFSGCRGASEVELAAFSPPRPALGPPRSPSPALFHASPEEALAMVAALFDGEGLEEEGAEALMTPPMAPGPATPPEPQQPLHEEDAGIPTPAIPPEVDADMAMMPPAAPQQEEVEADADMAMTPPAAPQQEEVEADADMAMTPPAAPQQEEADAGCLAGSSPAGPLLDLSPLEEPPSQQARQQARQQGRQEAWQEARSEEGREEAGTPSTAAEEEDRPAPGAPPPPQAGAQPEASSLGHEQGQGTPESSPQVVAAAAGVQPLGDSRNATNHVASTSNHTDLEAAPKPRRLGPIWRRPSSSSPSAPGAPAGRLSRDQWLDSQRARRAASTGEEAVRNLLGETAWELERMAAAAEGGSPRTRGRPARGRLSLDRYSPEEDRIVSERPAASRGPPDVDIAAFAPPLQAVFKGQLRTAYLNMKLASKWRAAEPWALCDSQGVAFCEERAREVEAEWLGCVPPCSLHCFSSRDMHWPLT